MPVPQVVTSHRVIIRWKRLAAGYGWFHQPVKLWDLLHRILSLSEGIKLTDFLGRQ